MGQLKSIKRYKMKSKVKRGGTRRLKQTTSSVNTPRPLKVAMLFAGRIKAYEEAKENLEKIKNKYNPVVFASLNKQIKSDYVKGFCDLMGIKDECLNIEVTPPYPDFINHVQIHGSVKDKWHRNPSAQQTTYSVFYQLHKGYKLIEAYENKHHMKFDVVLYYRADLTTTADLNIPNPVKEKMFYIPADCDHGGLCGAFFYGDTYVMKYVCNLVNRIKYMTEEQHHLYHTETLLKAHIDNNPKISVERFPNPHGYTNSRHKPHFNDKTG